MAATLSIVTRDIFVQVRAFFQTLVDCEIVKGLDNQVPMPAGDDFVVVTPGAGRALGASIETPRNASQAVEISQPTEFRVSVDCFGANAGNISRMLSMATRTSYACDQLTGMAPLFADDAVQFPLISGEEQYVERWRFDFVLQYTPVLTLPQQSMLSVNLDVVSVDATYRP